MSHKVAARFKNVVPWSAAAVLVLLVMMAVDRGLAQDNDKEKDAAKEKKVAATHDELRAMRDGILKAIKDKDVDTLLKYLHPDIVLTAQDGNDVKAIRKHAGVRDYVTRHLTGPKAGTKSLHPEVQVDELTILYGDGTGIAFGSSKDHYVLADGSDFHLPTRWSATMIKHEGQWKVANLQVATGWFDSPAVAAVTKMLYWVGGIAAVAGIVVGLVLMRLLRK